MRKVIPEKMVELWTANAVVAALGPSTRIWTPTHGFDQTARPVQGKRFVLELKAPKWETSEDQPSGFPSAQQRPSVAQPVEIDIGQLLEYVDTVDLEVIYVLPQPSHYPSASANGDMAMPCSTPTRRQRLHPRSAGANRVMELEAGHVRDGFSHWAYVICSSQLLRLIGSDTRVAALKSRGLMCPPDVSSSDRSLGGCYERGKRAMVACDMNGSTPQAFSLRDGVHGPGVEVMSLYRFLRKLRLCQFDHPLVERSTPLGASASDPVPEGLRPVESREADDAFWVDNGQWPGRSGRLEGSLLVVEVDEPNTPAWP